MSRHHRVTGVHAVGLADADWGVQLGIEVQSAPLAAHGVQTWHDPKSVVTGSLSRPLSVAVGRRV